MTQPSAIDDILAEHAGLETQLADPTLHNDPSAARRVGKRFAELAPIMATYRKLESARADQSAAPEKTPPAAGLGPRINGEARPGRRSVDAQG
ncbi:PCRF domain-containing protein, partial [Nocardia farcinica]|uniref:PCRF domain-containing protein n=1 Tax=Nocardia farcinica TaxID=37329 RepID=UPI0024562BCB